MADYKLAQNHDFDTESAESIRQYVSETAVPGKDRLLEYMQSFPAAAAAAGKVFDKISGKPTGIPILAYIQDGYFWNTNDIYYLEKYNIRMNDDFTAHVLAITN